MTFSFYKFYLLLNFVCKGNKKITISNDFKIKKHPIKKIRCFLHFMIALN